MAGIRTVLVTTPLILSDLIERLALGRVELHVVDKLGSRQALARRLQQVRPDLVIIGLRRSESDAVVTALLPVLPKAKFILFSHDARTVIGYELRITKTPLSNSTPDALISFICPESEEIGV